MPKPVDIRVATATEDGAIITIGWNKNFAGGQPTLLRYDTDRLTCPQPPSKVKLTSEVISLHCHWSDPSRKAAS